MNQPLPNRTPARRFLRSWASLCVTLLVTSVVTGCSRPEESKPPPAAPAELGSAATAILGDGVLDVGEACDDGNLAPGDGCNAAGQIEAGYKCTQAVTSVSASSSLCCADLATQFAVNSSATAADPVSNIIGMTVAAVINQHGSAWAPTTINVSQDFDMSFWVFLGAADGGHGVTFALQRSAGGSTQHGGSGFNLGFSPVTPALIVEYDTNNDGAGPNDIAGDHSSMWISPVTNPHLTPAVCLLPGCAEVENGVWRKARVQYDSFTKKLTSSFNGAVLQTATVDVTVQAFANNPLGVLWGFTAATGTGTLTNLQQVCLQGVALGSVCGNGTLNAGEGCDDGNTTNGDGCNSACLVETLSACNATAPGNTGSASCASGVCDAVGNVAPGICEAAGCGDGTLAAGEGCDDGNVANGDACSSTCKVQNTFACNATAPGDTGAASCTSGICDTVGNAAPGICEAPGCGNGLLEAGEGCDDGNLANGDACSSTCKVQNTFACNTTAPGSTGATSCASGICDTVGNAAPGICEAPGCGNGLLEAGEGCDDGNLANGDACSSTCKVQNTFACNTTAPGSTGATSCASGICDTVGNGAPGVCEAPGCGNGLLEAGEGCDDGNLANGDACSSTCKVQNTFACNTTAPGSTGATSCASGFCDTVGNAAPGICEAPGCGNGTLEAGEGCDDGNVANGDACSSTCKVQNTFPCNATAPGSTGATSCASGFCDTVGNAAPGVCEAPGCGNGTLEAGEGCDDGNLANGDACSSTCKVQNTFPCNATAPGSTGATSCASGFCDTVGNAAPGVCEAPGCGNGTLEAGEGCDDGNLANGDACSSTCKVQNTFPCNATAPGSTGATSCASGFCDTVGNAAPGVCEAPGCGNGTLEAGEGCDDGNLANGDACSSTCKVQNTFPCNATAPGSTGATSCASGFCDTVGNAAPGVCEAPGCGNGTLEAGEGCDDGNLANGDACSSTCKVQNTFPCNALAPGSTGATSCASGFCDTVGNAAPGVCEAPGCGNGTLEAGEGCDDGNLANGDACSSTCKVQNTFPCNATAPGSTGATSCASGFCDTVGNAAPGICEAPGCGNGTLEAGEGCDDGNLANGDACSSTCKVQNTFPCNALAPGSTGATSCASGFCDTVGNAAPGVCEAPGCGNGTLEAGEGCDDGNLANGDTCSSTCKVQNTFPCNATAPGSTGATSCASGFCDTVGNAAPGICEAPGCGNGTLEAGEGCDDGNLANGDTCSSTCKVQNTFPCNATAPGSTGATSCASGFCDTVGNAAPGICEAPGCGNGTLEAGEGCDDGNLSNGDTCNSSCKVVDSFPCNGVAPGNIGATSCASGACDTGGFPLPGICVPSVGCGNGTLDAGEGCDDGNLLNGDACTSLCKVADSFPCNALAPGSTGSTSCASGICDAVGNAAPGICEPAGCGNGKLEAGEGCDDGNLANGDTCSSTCKVQNTFPCNATAPGSTGATSCASGICDTVGNAAPGICEAPGCGNGKLEAGEGCDDGNTLNGDACTSTCKVPNGLPCNALAPGNLGGTSCENGVCDALGNAPPGICEPAGACGNGTLEAGEGCDDGNTLNGDACTSTCKVPNGLPCNALAPGNLGGTSCENGVCDALGNAPPGICEPAGACGNGKLEAGEGCDDGNTTNGDACTSTCKVPNGLPCNALAPGNLGGTSCENGVCDAVGNAPPGICEPAGACGNGTLEAGEGCDDGNTLNGDACTSTCKVPNGLPCNALAPGNLGGTSCENGVCDAVGNAPPGICEPAGACGNGTLEAGEGCDDGNTTNGDACTSTCKVPNGLPCNALAPGNLGGTSCENGVCDAVGNAPPGICEPAGACGNGTLEAGEGCDDGNTTNGDACTSTCKVPNGLPCNALAPGNLGGTSCENGVCDAIGNAPPGICEPAGACGNGTLEAGEGCDDGNTLNGDACTSTCKVPNGLPCNALAPGNLGGTSCENGVCDAVGNAPPGICEPAGACGNGTLEAGEGCDDGNTANGDACTSTCKVPNGLPCNALAPGNLGGTSCENGVCDAIGNAPPGICEPAGACGNGTLEAGEGCDDGNTTNGDACTSTCKVPNGLPCNALAPGNLGGTSCENGVCDAIGNAPPGICEPAGACGNGTLEAGEGCDDGNTANGDACTSTCKVPNGLPCNALAPGNLGGTSCENGVCDAIGNAPPGICEPAGACGNGTLEAGEGCDDGNTANGDTCTSVCKIPDGLPCNGDAPGNIGPTSCASGACNTGEFPVPGICEPLVGCGNGTLEAGEGCDDGNLLNGDACTSACKVPDSHPCNALAPGSIGSPSCESGICDLVGNAAPGSCEPAGCGNGTLEAGEGCDDGDVVGGDGCTATCLVENAFPCNDLAPGTLGAASCVSGVCDTIGAPLPGICGPAEDCGNGTLDPNEGCDDGNTTSADGCDATCLVEDFDPCNDVAPGNIGPSSCASGVCDTAANPLPGKCEPAGACGNGALEIGEGCDDGNTSNGDGCTATCLVENFDPCNDAAPGNLGASSCVSGVCDTVGTPFPGMCVPAETCGDTTLDAAEGCDDGNTNDGDGCNSTCLVEELFPCNEVAPGSIGSPSCASGVCDTAGNVAPGICEPAGACGNGKLDGGEGCDDGNTANGDGCNTVCLVEDLDPCNDVAPGSIGSGSCASGVCDATGNAPPGVCEPANACGNGTLESGEGCDDGNTASGDGCNTVCLVEDADPCNALAPGNIGSPSCASGVCDDVNNPPPGICVPANVCGDGTLDVGEGCDDGDTTNGDGCNSVCLVEDLDPCNELAPGNLGSPSCASGVCDTTGNAAPGICEPANACGNGKVDNGETCDDGNAVAGDGCNATCLSESCANIGMPCTVGEGACAASAVTVCVEGITSCGAVAGQPAPEVCGNGIDEDCDGDDDPCVCTDDSECGKSTSGKVCDAEASSKCIPGCRAEDGNGCPTGKVCTSTDATIGACVDPGGPGEAPQGNGIFCAAQPTRSGDDTSLAFMALLAVVGLRRRWARRVGAQQG